MRRVAAASLVVTNVTPTQNALALARLFMRGLGVSNPDHPIRTIPRDMAIFCHCFVVQHIRTFADGMRQARRLIAIQHSQDCRMSDMYDFSQHQICSFTYWCGHLGTIQEFLHYQ